MQDLKVGDIVARKSYGGDVPFVIVDIIENRGSRVYTLKGLASRLVADSHGDDLVRQTRELVYSRMEREMAMARTRTYRRRPFFMFPFFKRVRTKPGRVLHIDSSPELMDMCIKHYRDAGVPTVTKLTDESEQPGVVRSLLERYNPDILVVTGHDSMKKNAANLGSLENYSNSKYFIQSVKEARKYQPDFDRLCIFAGACQSYYEGIMGAGANFASSPGRILINALDPAIVSEKIALTDTRTIVTPAEISVMLISGRDGVGGINTRGHLTRY